MTTASAVLAELPTRTAKLDEAGTAEVARLQERLLAAATRLADELIRESASDSLPEIAAMQQMSEAFLHQALGYLDDLAHAIADEFREVFGDLPELIEGAATTDPAGAARLGAVAEAQLNAAERSLGMVVQYLAGYVHAGGIPFSLLVELERPPYDDAEVIRRVVMGRLMFVAEHAEGARAAWRGEAILAIETHLRALGDAGGASVKPQVSRLQQLLDQAASMGVKLRKIPDKPSDAWLSKLQLRLEELEASRDAKSATRSRAGETSQRRLSQLMALANSMRVRVRTVPERPSTTWLDKMEAKLRQIAAKRNHPLPDDFSAPSPTEEVSKTRDRPPERETGPQTLAAPEEVEALVAKAEALELNLGRVPASPTAAWLEEMEQALDKAKADRKAKRRAERKRKEAERKERIERLKLEALHAGIDLTPFPKFPTDDWLARAEMRVAQATLAEQPQEDAGEQTDRGARLASVLQAAEQFEVELGEVPPDPDLVWLTWAESRVADAQSDEIFEVGGDPDEPRQPMLVYEEGSLQEQSWVLDQEQTTIGRARRADIQVRNDAGVSRLHCTVLVDEDGIYIRDDNSTKGTWVNGTRVEGTMMLSLGDLVLVGESEFVVRE